MKAGVFGILAVWLSMAASAQNGSPQRNKVVQWFTPYNFNAASFKKPAHKFGPFTRWWWPGNDVTNEELQREVALFAANGFAGVEIQPFDAGLNAKGPQAQLQRQLSWDSPSFYEHLKTAMEAARRWGIIVDLNAGSGWPVGGPQITPDSSLLTLTYADTLIEGGQPVSFSVPHLKQEKFTIKPSAFQLMQTVPVSYAKLQAVIAAKVLKKENNQTFLAPETVQNITSLVITGNINWQAPAGSWKVMAFYSMPDGELPKSIALPQKGFVTDYLDANKLFAGLDHLLGARTGLSAYFGNPLRAIFNDSYEFMPDRHYSYNFLSFFKQHRGYDITPYLPVNMKKFYNNAYLAPASANQPFDNYYSDEDWRLRYDYDVTVGDLFKEQFIQSGNKWLNRKGLLHRTQAYGTRLDVIGASGTADIPETEQLAGSNSEGFLKLITSGAHLYNKPLIAQESFVFQGLNEMTTPQKIRLLADKSFAAGVNQIIYHGTPYKYQTGEYGKEGWSPFSSPYSFGMLSFSSTINESWPYWKDIKTINQYIARCQYMLQLGKPHADVLIYFPFNDFYPEQAVPNPKEILVKGQFRNVEPETSSIMPVNSKHDDKAMNWFNTLWPLVNMLEANGITWDFVNDGSLQQAATNKNDISINGNSYTTLVLANVPYIPLPTAGKLAELAKEKANILFYGALPEKQPSWLNYEENDKKTKQLIQTAISQSGVRQLTEEPALHEWMNTLPTKLTFSNPYNFTRTIERQMSDGSRIKFIWNKSDQWQKISINTSKDLSNFYWLNAETGIISKNKGNAITYTIPPYGSVFGMATNAVIPDNSLSPMAVPFNNSAALMKLEQWNITIGDTMLKNAALFNWKENGSFKYRSDKGTYTTTFSLDKKEPGKKYLLDLGSVFFTAAIMVNGKPAGKLLWAPYSLDITSLLKQGTNAIEILVTPTSRNEFIGEAIKGNAQYAQFRRKEKTLMPAGLIGPVVLKTLH